MTYNFNVDSYPQMNLPNGVYCGVLAQDVEGVLPGAVVDVVIDFSDPESENFETGVMSPCTFKAVNYNEIVALLVEAQ